MPGAGGIGAGVSPAGHGADHETGVALAQEIGREAEARQGARPEALQEDIGPLQETAEDLLAVRLLEVERHALDAGEEEGGEAPHSAHGIALRGLLHLDHPRPEVGQEPAGQGAGEMAGEVEDEGAGEHG